MTHDTEFQNREEREAAEKRRMQDAREMACIYAHVFSGDDGQRVLKDLQAKFSHARSRFTARSNYSVVGAATIDGQCDVLREIEQAIAAGSRFPQTK